MTQLNFQKLMNALNEWYPQELADSWDKVGLHFGHGLAPVQKVMISLDLRPNVVEEAVAHGVDTIVLHHPPIFREIKRMDWSDPQLAMYRQVIKADLNVFAMHTNFDRARQGMNDCLTQQLGLECIVDLEGQDQVPSIGRVGNLPRPLTRPELFEWVKSHLACDHFKWIEKESQVHYQRVAVIGGAGSDFLGSVLASQADVFITGDITYHTGHDLLESGLLSIDAGHYIERAFIPFVAERLRQVANLHQWDLEIVESQVNTNPFNWE